MFVSVAVLPVDHDDQPAALVVGSGSLGFGASPRARLRDLAVDLRLPLHPGIPRFACLPPFAVGPVPEALLNGVPNGNDVVAIVFSAS